MASEQQAMELTKRLIAPLDVCKHIFAPEFARVVAEAYPRMFAAGELVITLLTWEQPRKFRPLVLVPGQSSTERDAAILAWEQDVIPGRMEMLLAEGHSRARIPSTESAASAETIDAAHFKDELLAMNVRSERQSRHYWNATRYVKNLSAFGGLVGW